MIAGLLALFAMAVKVSGLSDLGNRHYYLVTAEFDNIGGLKVRAPVSVSGVTIGRIGQIELDPKTLRAKVVMQISNQYRSIPADSSASILTQGLLGANYISLTPGFDETSLHAGSMLTTTHSALILENLIGQLIYHLKGDKSDKK